MTALLKSASSSCRNASNGLRTAEPRGLITMSNPMECGLDPSDNLSNPSLDSVSIVSFSYFAWRCQTKAVMLRPFGRTNTTKERDTRFAPFS
jgi:hypothetical protein